jgi:hypothetical protein
MIRWQYYIVSSVDIFGLNSLLRMLTRDADSRARSPEMNFPVELQASEASKRTKDANITSSRLTIWIE